jgi:hypothetical protein
MAMTKTDYEVTADAINGVLWMQETDLATMTRLTMALVSAYMGRYGDKFDKGRFIERAWRTPDTVSEQEKAR